MIYILLPAYNEEKDIRSLLDRICEAFRSRQTDYSVIVVNDGSQDGTGSVVQSCAERMPVIYLDHGVNKGLGQAMLTGFQKAAEISQPGDVLVAMDADNTHDPAIIHAMVERIQSGSDLVIASRYQKGGEEIGLAFHRHLFSKTINTGLKILFPITGAKDYTCGYRAYRASLLKSAFDTYEDRFIEERGFTCMAEILIKLSRLKIQVTEVPLILRYDLKSGASKMKVVRTIARYFALIWKSKFHPSPIPAKIPA